MNLFSFYDAAVISSGRNYIKETYLLLKNEFNYSESCPLESCAD